MSPSMGPTALSTEREGQEIGCLAWASGVALMGTPWRAPLDEDCAKSGSGKRSENPLRWDERYGDILLTVVEQGGRFGRVSCCLNSLEASDVSEIEKHFLRLSKECEECNTVPGDSFASLSHKVQASVNH